VKSINKTNNMKRLIISLTIAISAIFGASAQDKVVRKVIETGLNDNQTMAHEDFLSNRIGGRPIGSHSLEDAEAWAAEQFRSWGLEVMVQEVGEINVGFGRGPWFGRMLSEDGMYLHFGTPSYTSGTKGPQKGHVLIEPKNRREFEKMKGVLKGAWVLIGGQSGFPINSSAKADARRAEVIAKNEEIEKQNREIMAYNNQHRDEPKELLKMEEEPALFYREMVEAGVLGFIQSAKVPITMLYDRANCYDMTMETLPTVCDIKLDEHQYKIIEQKARERQDFLLEFDIRNHFFRGPVKYHNIIGIIRGSKHPDEYVIMGGHLDAYDGGTGSVDDANGTAVTMEAARLLALSGAKPERTMMFCLWTGEEYGLLGSKFFVENKTVPLEKISNYFNRDGGTNVYSSITVPEDEYDNFVKICKPLEDFWPGIPFTVLKKEGGPQPRPKKSGGSDHAYFVMNGVPAISLNENDPLGRNFDYREIWHTERDTYNKLVPEYLEYSAVSLAVVAYGLANMDHLMSRKMLYKDE